MKKKQNVKAFKKPILYHLFGCYFLVITIQQTELSVMNTCKFQNPKHFTYKHHIALKSAKKCNLEKAKLGAQSFTSLMADLYKQIFFI